MLQIHGVNASPFVRKVRIAFDEKGVEYELIPVMPIGVSEEFRRISPLGKIPCITDGDYALPDSSCILAYAERRWPEPALWPEDPEELGRALWFEEYADTRLNEVLTTVFFQRVVQGRIMKQEVDEEVCQRILEEEVPPVFDYLDGELAAVGDVAGIVGGRFGVADIGLVSPFINFEHSGEAVDPGRWPALVRYVERLCERPSIAKIVAEEKAAFAAL